MTTLNAPAPAHTLIEAPDASFYVPGKPVSVNRMYGTGYGGKRYLTPDAQAWETLVAYKARAACADLKADIRRGALTLPLRVKCTFYNTRCDVDNLLKSTLDGLKAGLSIDDKHFARVDAVKAEATGTFTDGALISIWASRDPQLEAAIERGIEKGERAIMESERPQIRFHRMQSSLLPGGYFATDESNNRPVGCIAQWGNVWVGWCHIHEIPAKIPDFTGKTRREVAEKCYTARQKEAKA